MGIRPLSRHLIVNSHTGPDIFKKLKDFFVCHNITFTTEFCTDRQQAVSSTRSALENGARQIIAVGGDGTLNAVVEGFFKTDALVNPQATLGLVPGGTGADYFRSFFDSGNDDWLIGLLKNNSVLVDVGRVELPGSAKVNYFLNMLTWGLSAEVALIRNSLSPRVPKNLVYPLSALKALPLKSSGNFTLELTDAQGHRKKLVVEEVISSFIAKGNFFGRGILHSSEFTLENLQDGLLRVAFLKDRNWFHALLHMPSLFRAGLPALGGVDCLQARELVFTSNRPVALEADGEFLGRVREFSVATLPGRFRVVAPVA